MVNSAKYLVETDWAVYYLRGREPYVSKLKAFRQDGLSVSVVSLAELYEGVFREPKQQDKERTLNNFLTGVDVIDVTQDVARTFGNLRAQLRSQGITVSDLDLLIGSTAIYYGLVVLTNNRRHFEKIPQIQLFEEN
jgi:tRNA(fMet)-specific endonuclease VapC